MHAKEKTPSHLGSCACGAVAHIEWHGTPQCDSCWRDHPAQPSICDHRGPGGRACGRERGHTEVHRDASGVYWSSESVAKTAKQEPPPLSIEAVERIARLAIAKVMCDALGSGDHDASGVRVVVDINRRWRDVGGHIVWLEHGGRERRTLIAAREGEWQASERLAEAAFELLAQVGASVVARGGR